MQKSQIGGILSIISGVLAVLGALALFAFILFFGLLMRSLPDSNGAQEAQAALAVIGIIYGLGGFFLLALGALAIIGGVFALRQRNWGLALAGAIAATITFFPCGVAATILIAMAQPEFGAPKPATPPVQ